MNWKNLAIFSALVMTSCSGLDAGWKAQRAGDYDEAQRQAIIALMKEPRNPDVYRLVATTAMSRGQYDNALKSAQFASSLDGGSDASEQLIREICTAKKDWPCLCEAGLRTTQKNGSLVPEDASRFRQGYDALSGASESYGCLIALEKQGQTIDNAGKVKAAYAEKLAARGKMREAFAIEDTIDEPSVRLLNASKRLYAMSQPADAASRLREYVATADSSNREQRITEASAVCENYRDWNLQAELLESSQNPEHEISRAIALRKSFRAEDSNAILQSHFARTDRTPLQVLGEVKKLTNAGYGEAAVEAYSSCSACSDDPDSSIEAANVFYNIGQTAVCNQIMTHLSDTHENDSALQVRIFNWYRERKLNNQALYSAEKAAKLGVSDPIFHENRLEAYLDSREIRSFERESAAWIASQEPPATQAREAVARLESKRSNWEGIINILNPVADAGQLKGKPRDLYFKSFQSLKQYKELYDIIGKHGSDLTPLQKADYFFDIEAETEYRNSLAPMLSGSHSEQYTAELKLAEYLIIIKEDEASGRESIDRAIKVSDKQDDAYDKVVQFLRDMGQLPMAIEYAVQWRNAFPKDDRPCAILGRLYLANHLIPEASEAFDAYVSNRDDKYPALRHGYQEFTRFSESEAGLDWVENQTLPVLERGENPEYLYALTESRFDEYKQNPRKRVTAFRSQIIDGYRRLLNQSPEKALSFAADLTSLEAYEDAADAYDVADQKAEKWRFSQRVERVRIMLLAGRSDKEIQKAVNIASDTKETFQMVEMLNKSQALEYGEEILEKQLDDENMETRLRAFSYLVRLNSDDGNFDKIKKYGLKLEDNAPNNADIHMKLAELALSYNDFDEAVRHLTFLQTVRPDAREVLNLEMELARRAPDHAGAQALISTVFDAAEGVFHRLDWISQSFEQYGDIPRALHYAEKAYASSTASNDELKVRLIGLYLRAGSIENNTNYQQILNSLQKTALWNAATLQNLSEEAQNAGYYDQAQAWMKEAIALEPEQLSLKRRKLEMALDSESQGQIAMSLEEAIAPPVAEVMDPLRENGSYLDAFSAIELFEQNGEYEMATASLLSVLPYYVEARGITTATRSLKTYSESQPAYQSSIARILAGYLLMGDTPCDALAYAADLEDQSVWARLLIRCQEAQSSIFSSIRDTRQSMSKRRRVRFDEGLYQELVQAGQASIAMKYAQEMEMADGAYEQFERMLLAGSPLDALTGLAKMPVDPEKITDVYGMLVSYGYTKEALDYARQQMNRIPERDKTGISASAILLGAKDKVFLDNIPGDRPDAYESMMPWEVSELIALDELKRWLRDTPTSHMTPVIHIAMQCASRQEQKADEILTATEEAIGQHHSRVSLYVTASQEAVKEGLYQGSLRFLNKLADMVPASDYVHRLYSISLARLGKTNEAWRELEEGSRCTSQLTDYWQRAADMHAESSIEIRQNINAARRRTHPRMSSLLVEAAALSLEQGQIEDANQWAHQAYDSGHHKVLPDLANAYEAANAMNAFPEDLCRGSGTTATNIQARIALAKGDENTAIEKLSDAILSSPWPPDAYAQIIEIMMEQGRMDRVEQLIAQWMSHFPHASRPYAYRAVYDIEQDKTEDAWSDYLSARKRALDTSFWIGPLIQETAKRHKLELAQKLHHNEKLLGSLDDKIWLQNMLTVFSNKDLAAKQQIPYGEYASQGMRFIHAVLPSADFIAKQDAELNARYQTLKKSGT